MPKDQSSIRIPLSLLKDKEICKTAICFYVYVKHNPTAKNKEAAKQLNTSIRNVQRTSEILNRKGYITHEKLHDYSWKWIVNI